MTRATMGTCAAVLAVAFMFAAAPHQPQADGPLCPGYAAVLAAQEVIGDSPDVALYTRAFFGCAEKYPGG